MKHKSGASITQLESSSLPAQRASALVRIISFFLLAMFSLCATVSSASPLNISSADHNLQPSNSAPAKDIEKTKTTGNDSVLNIRQEEYANFAFSFLIPKPLNYLLMPPPSAPTNLEIVSPTETLSPLSSLIRLRWTASSGAVSYQIERSTNILQGFKPYTTSTTTTFNDTPPNGTPPASVQTYLYRVRALDSSGASAPSNIAFATSISFTDPTITPHVTVIRGQHLRELRWAVDAVRRAAGLGDVTWTDPTPEGVVIQADHIRKLREKLGEALTALSVPVAAYTDAILYTGASGTLVRHEHFQELRERSTRGSSTSSGPSSSGNSSSTARLDPMNQTGGGGENPLSGNFNWSLPLVGLKGRAGLDLGLSLSYNSLVWTKSGSSVSFDDDRGFPAPGFRLGFPVIQSAFYNSEAGKYAYMLITPDGGRTELRQVGTSSLYEATDSSYLVLDSSTMTLSTTDGTQLSYALEGSDYECTQIKDSNGNFITINYSTATGQIDTIVDTLSRTIKFNYDATTGYLSSITQDWGPIGQTPQQHQWARFTYSSPDLPIQTSFPSLTVLGPQNGTTIKVLTQVKLDDESHFDFDYTPWGQVWKIKSYAPNGDLLNYRAYDMPGSTLRETSAQDNCPRFTERHDWAENWNRSASSTGASGLPSGSEQEVVTHYDAPDARTWTLPDGTTSQTGLMVKVTMPDQTYQQIYYAGTANTSTGWQRGLPSLVNTYDSSNTLQRQAVTLWTQDDTNASYQLNPRVSETHIYDPAGNHKRTRITYQSVSFTDGTTCNLPQDVSEYQPDATTILRYTHTTYNLSTTYTSRRIIGLVSEKTLTEGDPNSTHTLRSQVGFAYDETDSIQGTNPSFQHDNTNYGTDSSIVRGLLTSVKRYNVDDTSQFTISTSKYNTAGAVVSTTDPLGHGVSISYADDFSDSGRDSLNTLAYPTVVTDAGGFKSYAKYNYDFGATTWTRTPKPNVTDDQSGPQQTFEYDSLGRIQKVTNSTTGAYTEYAYSSSGTRLDTYTTTQWDAAQTNMEKAHSFTIIDGMGRVIATASDHPGSDGGFSGQLVMYDVMGRVVKKSNPTETTADTTATPVNPAQWVATGDDSPTPPNNGAGWVYTQQAYDWKGRPTITTNVDGTTKQLSYGGCGCAGGEQVTIEGELVPTGQASPAPAQARRTQKVYHDILGRAWKTETLNWDGSIYSSQVTIYNALDQARYVREYPGQAPADASDPNASCPTGTCQQSVMTYDGYGRLKTEQAPSQTAATQYNYNTDDTVHDVTDGRGAGPIFTYNSRRLVTDIRYPTVYSISDASEVTYNYDAVGNRTLMTDGMGSVSYQYDELSRLTAETRYFNQLSGNASTGGNYTLSYEYTLSGALKKLTDPFGAEFNYGFDSTGRLSSVTGSAYGGVNTYVSTVSYRAWGAVKSASFGSGASQTTQYNAMMRPTQYRATNAGASILSEDFGYYADGRLGGITDLDDTSGNTPDTIRYMSRSYSYDHAGRVTRSGGSAAITPYQQTYAYDAFSNLTSRTGTYNWDQAPQSDTATYTNNKRQGWTYDNDGRLTSSPANSASPSRTWRYDTAGRLTGLTDTAGSSTTTGINGYDGDGQLLYSYSYTNYGPYANPTSSTTAGYVVRSSVLKGEVVTKLDSSGDKEITYVPAGGLLVAQQAKDYFHQPVVNWMYRDPVGVTEGASGMWPAAYDPLGNRVQLVSHPPAPPPPPQFYYGTNASGWPNQWGGANNYSTGCMAASNNPQDCNGTMREGMTLAFYLNLPGVYDDMGQAMAGHEAYVTNRYNAHYANEGASGYAADSGSSDLDTNTVTIYGGAAFVQTSWVMVPGSQNVGPEVTQQKLAPLDPYYQKTFDTARGKLLNDLDTMDKKSKCARFLSKIPGGLSAIAASIRAIQPYSGRDSEITYKEAGVIDYGDPQVKTLSQAALAVLENKSVSDLFRNGYGGAVTGSNNRVFFGPFPVKHSLEYAHATILHESLHALTGFDDNRLATLLFGKTFTNNDKASEAISKALKDNGCTKSE